jgi:ATP-binding cassette subfamily B protein
MDEPTAALDVRAEHEFFNRVLEATSGLTTVLVSHRFSTVRRADDIAIIKAGHVAEYGRHEDLVHEGGQYAGLFRAHAALFH